jgi:hypothetical protein
MEKEEEEVVGPDLCHCQWYHGPTTRIASELSLRDDGDFLVRDCISSPGDFVLTSRWRGQTLHFRMNRLIEQQQETVEAASSAGQHYPPELFQFEDEAFASVAELILHHAANQGSEKQLSLKHVFSFDTFGQLFCSFGKAL